MNKENKIYFIILNYQTYKDTIVLVEDLLQQQKIQTHIVIIDNNSPNNSYEKLLNTFEKNTRVEIIKSKENGGYSTGNNIGLRHIKKYNPKYVAVLNNDIRLKDTMLFNSLLTELNKFEKSAYFAAPSMILAGKEKFTAWKVPTIASDLKRAVLTIKKIFGSPDSYHFEKKRKTEKVECLPGSFLFGYYKKFEKIGFFDEDIFLFGEENILGYKIKLAGGTNLLCRQYFFDHAWSSTIDRSVNRINRIKLQNSGRVFLHERYLKTPQPLILFLKLLLQIRLLEEYILVLFRNPKALFRQ